MKAIKVKINDVEHCKAVQLDMYKMGYFWGMFKGSKEPQFLRDDIVYLYTYEDGYIVRNYVGCTEGSTRQDLEVEFERHEEEEYILAGPSLVSKSDAEALKKSPLGLKPRYIHEAQRTQEILAAMLRYSEAGEIIPNVWKDELFDLFYSKEIFQ